MELITASDNLSHRSVTDVAFWPNIDSDHILKCIKEDGCQGLKSALELIGEHADLIELCQILHFTHQLHLFFVLLRFFYSQLLGSLDFSMDKTKCG